MQNFAKLLCDKSEGMKGVWGDGEFKKLEHLSKTLTTMVFILSNVHAAANFNQYDEYGYPPNLPFRLDGAPPTNKVCDFQLSTHQLSSHYIFTQSYFQSTGID